MVTGHSGGDSCFNIQTSQWSEAYYFNVGVYFRSLGNAKAPAEWECQIRFRIPDYRLHGDKVKLANRLADFSGIELGAEEQINELKDLVYPLVIDWFSRFGYTANAKTELMRIDRPWFMISNDIWPLIGLPMPKFERGK
jgi:hypothetical protein